MKLTAISRLVLLLAAALTAFAASPAGAGEETRAGLAGTWLFVEDQTPGPKELARRPNMGKRLDVRAEEGATTFEWLIGQKKQTYRCPSDGSEETVTDAKSATRHRGSRKGDSFVIDTGLEAAEPGANPRTTVAQYVLTLTGDELVVDYTITKPFDWRMVCLYRRAPKDLPPPPKPATADLKSMTWLAGAWTGTFGKASIEERWGPAGGGAMLATSRTISGGRMVAFEYLRIVERDGGLVYVAQPNGGAVTEFVLTSVAADRAVFENPLHDFPQRISYTLAADGVLTAEIANTAGTKSTAFVFRREGAK